MLYAAHVLLLANEMQGIYAPALIQDPEVRQQGPESEFV